MYRKAIVTAFLCSGGIGLAAQPPEYAFEWLDTGNLVATWANFVSNDGVVIGNGVDQAGFERGVIWSGGGMQVLPTPAGYDNVQLTSANNRGLSIGSIQNVDKGYSTGIWDGQAWTVIEPWDGFENVWLDNINDAGVAVGQMDPAWGGPTPIRVQNGVVEELPVLPEWQGAYAMRELDDGTILGVAATDQYTTRAVRWVDGQPEVLSRPNNSTSLFVTTSGSGGHIAMYDFTLNVGSWVWDGQKWNQPDGIVDLNGYIQGFNSFGDFVADSWNVEEPLLGIGGDLFFVRDLVDLPDQINNAHFLGINDGEMAAGLVNTDARPWAVVLRPVPSSSTLALLGLSGLFACRRKRRAIVIAVVLAPGLAIASQPPHYFVDVIGLHGTNGSWHNAIDDDGRVVGTYENLPGVWQDGQIEYLPCPTGSNRCSVSDISKAGILGMAVFDYIRYPVVWVDGEPSVLEIFGEGAWPFAISASGQVVGWGKVPLPENPPIVPFVWKDGVAINIGSLGRGGGEARGINTPGHAVGIFETRGVVIHAFFWASDEMTDLGVLPNLSHAVAVDINDTDTVVGTCYSFSWALDTPFIWKSGVMSALPALGEYGLAKSINNDGVIVGVLRSDSIDAYAVAWIDDEVYRFDDHLVSGDAWQISNAIDINNLGQILAIGTLDGQEYGVVLTPACPADFNLDRSTNTRDVIDFLQAWVADDSDADFNEDGTIDSRDVAAFLDAWASGCG